MVVVCARDVLVVCSCLCVCTHARACGVCSLVVCTLSACGVLLVKDDNVIHYSENTFYFLDRSK